MLEIHSPEEIPIETADPQKAKKQQLPTAEIGLCYCNQLFRIERTLKDLDEQDRKARRFKLEVPGWDDFWKWLGTLKPLGGSWLEKAVNYAENHQELIENYLTGNDGFASIILYEYQPGRQCKCKWCKIKRHHIYSLVETAKANHLNVFQYLYTLLLYMLNYKDKPAGVEAMMPWSEFIKERCSGVKNTETETPENRGQIPV